VTTRANSWETLFAYLLINSTFEFVNYELQNWILLSIMKPDGVISPHPPLK